MLTLLVVSFLFSFLTVFASAQGTVMVLDINNEVLKPHNDLRNKYCIGPLKWNQYLAKVAENYMKVCPGMAHNANRTSQYATILANNNQPVPPSSGTYPWIQYVGENIAYAWGYPSPYVDTQGWQDEAPGYNCNTGFGGGGHFTQMIWNVTTDVGCAKINCNGDYYLICNYWPGGNYGGLPSGPVCPNCPTPHSAYPPPPQVGPPQTGTPTSRAPTRAPTTATVPTRTPTRSPTRSPTVPTAAPTSRAPTRAPTTATVPTRTPTRSPTRSPTAPTAPTTSTRVPTRVPTRAPTVPTRAPTRVPTRTPTVPTRAPTRVPTRAPTTVAPTAQMTLVQIASHFNANTATFATNVEGDFTRDTRFTGNVVDLLTASAVLPSSTVIDFSFSVHFTAFPSSTQQSAVCGILFQQIEDDYNFPSSTRTCKWAFSMKKRADDEDDVDTGVVFSTTLSFNGPPIPAIVVPAVVGTLIGFIVIFAVVFIIYKRRQSIIYTAEELDQVDTVYAKV